MNLFTIYIIHLQIQCFVILPISEIYVHSMVSTEVDRMLAKGTLDAECSCDGCGMLRIWCNGGGYGIVLILAFILDYYNSGCQSIIQYNRIGIIGSFAVLFLK